MIHAYIIDDEPKAVETTEMLLRQYVPKVGKISFSTSALQGVEEVIRLAPDLLFLDIDMPQLDGFRVLERLESVSLQVIFITAYDHFAIQAIRFSALDYLLKPIDPGELRAAVLRFIEGSTPRQPNKALLRNALQNFSVQDAKQLTIAVPDGAGHFFLKPADVLRCEADRNYTVFHLTDGRRLISSKTLKDYEDLLSEHGFLRVHKSHLLNLDYVEKYLGRETLRLKNGLEIEVSRRRRTAVAEVLKTRL